MKEFLLELIEGLDKDKIDEEYKEIIDNLNSYKALRFSANQIRLDSKFRIGTLSITQKGIGYLDPINETSSKDLLIEEHNLNGANSGDIVLAKRIFSKRGSSAKILFVLKRAFVVSVVYLKKVNNMLIAKNIKTDLPLILPLSQEILKKYGEGRVLKVDNETLEVIEELGDLDEPKVDEKISLAIYNKVEEFTKEAKEEAKVKGDIILSSDLEDRVDLRDMPFCTIDPVDAKDFDDAIYFDLNNYTLYVAIADVSEYVIEDSFLDIEAKKRGFSIYFPHKSIPMLPRFLSENICSLKPNLDRLAFVVKIELDKKSLKPIKESFFEAVIHSKRRFTYEEIDRFLKGDFSKKREEDDTILEYLLPLEKLLSKIRKDRLSKGCEFSSSEIRMILDKNQNLISTIKESETPSHALIEDAMLLANKAAAKLYEKGLFRTHDYPDLQKIDKLLNELEKIGIELEADEDPYKTFKEVQKEADKRALREEIDKLLIKTQKQAIYSDEALSGHFGLGFKLYTHFTSPIRRYSDLIVHRLIKAILSENKKKIEYIQSNAKIIAQRVSELEREATMVEWDFMDRKYARYFDKHKDEIFQAMVVDITSSTPVSISLGNIEGARIFLNSDIELELFEKINIKITDSYITNTKIIAIPIK